MFYLPRLEYVADTILYIGGTFTWSPPQTNITYRNIAKYDTLHRYLLFLDHNRSTGSSSFGGYHQHSILLYNHNRKWLPIQPVGFTTNETETINDMALVKNNNNVFLYVGGAFDFAGNLQKLGNIAGCNGDGIWVDNVITGTPNK